MLTPTPHPGARGGSATPCSPARAAGAVGPQNQVRDAWGAWGATGAAGACGSTGAGAAAGTAWRSAAWRRRAAGLATAGTPSAGIFVGAAVGSGSGSESESAVGVGGGVDVAGTAVAFSVAVAAVVAVVYYAFAPVSAADLVGCVGCDMVGGCVAIVGIDAHGVQIVRFACAPAGKTPGLIVSSFGSVNASASANVSVCECGHDLRLWPLRWQPTHAMSSQSPTPLVRPLRSHRRSTAAAVPLSNPG